MKFIEPTKQTKDNIITIKADDLANIISQNLEEVFDDFPTIALEMLAATITCEVIRNSEKSKKEEKPTENKEEKKTVEDRRKKYEEAVSNALADLVKTLFEE